MAIDDRIQLRLALTARFSAVLDKPNETIEGEEFVCQVCPTSKPFKASRAHAIAEHCLAHVRRDELERPEEGINWQEYAKEQAKAEAAVRAGLRPLELD